MGNTQLNRLPRALRGMLAPIAFDEDQEGRSGTAIYRVTTLQNTAAYLKIARAGSEQDLRTEMTRLLWLRHQLPVPDILYFAEADGWQYLLLSAIDGKVVYHDDLRHNLPEVLRLYAEGLRQIHAIPITTCPFDQRLEIQMSEAQRRLAAGVVDEDDFDITRSGRSAQAVYQELRTLRQTLNSTTTEALVFTHGDYCTPNVLIDPSTWTISGFIDWGKGGVADRYQDLALAVRSIDYNFGAEWIMPFVQAYGLEALDPVKTEFYQLLDEFF